MSKPSVSIVVSDLKRKAEDLNFTVTNKMIDIDKQLEDILEQVEHYKELSLSEVEGMLEDVADKIVKLRKSL